MQRFLPPLFAAVLVASFAFAAVETATVSVKKTSIRRDHEFFAPTITEASLGESFEVLAREKGWVKVTTKSGAGWLHETSVTAKKVVASSQGPAGGKVDDRDVANAVKGFGPPTEAAYRQKNPSANFAAVDRVERLGASDAEIAAFVSGGGLKSREAGR